MPTNPILDREIREELARRRVQPLTPGVVPGAVVQVRGRRSRLTAIVPRDDCSEIHLERDGRRPQILLWPFDRITSVDRERRIRVVGVRPWLRALTRESAAEVDCATPRGVSHDVSVIPYQLSPAIAMAAGCARVLL